MGIILNRNKVLLDFYKQMYFFKEISVGFFVAFLPHTKAQKSEFNQSYCYSKYFTHYKKFGHIDLIHVVILNKKNKSISSSITLFVCCL